MADRSVVVRLRAEASQFKREMDSAAKSSENVAKATGNAISRNEKHISTLSTQVGALGLAMTAAAVAAVKSFADFDQAMSNVAATGEDATNSLGALRDAALEAGRETAFGAREAADGIEELLKAGVSAGDVLDGGLAGSLDLAASGQLAVGEAAEIAATALTQFGLAGNQVSHVADLLASGASKAQGGVGDLGMALKQSGLVANQVGLSIEETTAGLSAFAAAGLIGSDAGTSFKSMLQRLTPQSAEAKQLMDELGISAYDAQGNFTGLAEFAGSLQDGLKGLTNEQRNSALATIFGSDAVRAAAVIYDQGEQGIRDWTEAVDAQGFAAETAATRLDNLNGDLKILKGSLETALIGLGEGADGPLRDLVQQITDIVNAFAELPPWVQGTALALVGGGGLVTLGIAGMAKLAIGVNNTITSLQGMGTISEVTAGRMTRGLGKVAKAAGIAAAAYAAVLIAAQVAEAASDRKVVDGVEATTAALLEMQDAADTASIDALFDGFSGASGNVNDFASAVERVANTQAADKVDDIGTSLLGVSNAGDKAREQIATMGDALAGFVSSGDPERAAAQFELLYSKLDPERISKEELMQLMPAYGEALAGVANESKLAAENTGDLTAEVVSAAAATEEATKAHDEWVATLVDANAAFIDLTGAYDDVIAKNQEIARSTADATEDATDSWEDYYDGTTVSAADYIAQLQAQVDAVKTWRANIDSLTARANAGDQTPEQAAAANALLDELIAQGPAGAAEAALLASMSDEDFAKVVALWSEKGAETGEAWALGIEDARTPELALDSQEVQDKIDRAVQTWQNISAIKPTLRLSADGGLKKTSTAMGAFADGGFTGWGGKYEPAGIVHRGEFVADQRMTSRYRPLLEAMHAGRAVLPGYAGGGMVGESARSGQQVVRVDGTRTLERFSPIHVDKVYAADVGDFLRQTDRRRAQNNTFGG
jgi:TP901 family phage tail tape measure protein